MTDDRSPDKKYAFPNEEMMDAEEKLAGSPGIARWKCGHCGKIVEGEAPPEKCPRCGYPGSQFTRLAG